MGWIRIGTPSKEQSQAGCLLAIIIVVVSVVAIVYNESTFKMIRVIHSKPASESNSAAFEYLKRKPQGRHAQEASDTLLEFISSLPSYTIPTVNGKPIPMSWENNNLLKFRNTKNQVPGSPAESALDSLIRARLDEEYEKACILNTEEGWKLFDFIVPDEYKGLHTRNSNLTEKH